MPFKRACEGACEEHVKVRGSAALSLTTCSMLSTASKALLCAHGNTRGEACCLLDGFHWEDASVPGLEADKDASVEPRGCDLLSRGCEVNMAGRVTSCCLHRNQPLYSRQSGLLDAWHIRPRRLQASDWLICNEV